ncbi:MAG: MotA/TolQ/ExbB proton channel family protein [Planctomycetaceae bacterium]|nr:MotA/TolQ/ExbB proton channel family protein [Planctomycetaceae bacterium]
MQNVESANKSIKDYKDYTLIDLILAAGIIGHTIILLSIIAVAFMIEHFLTIREKILIPPGLADEVAKSLNEGRWNDAAKRCHDDPSVLGIVLAAGLKECEIGWNSVEKAAEDAMAEQAARLYRKTEYLNVIGNIAPMIGLLGTVVGLLIAFHDMAALEGYQQRAGDLAGGIYLALVTTVQGLLVAIPSLAAYAIFNNRIALLMAETTYIAEQILRPVKKRLASSRQKADGGKQNS